MIPVKMVTNQNEFSWTQHQSRGYQSYNVKPASENVDTLFISSSMFRHLDHTRLSTPRQKAGVLFYPGADALQMSDRITRDPKFHALDKGKVQKVFVMAGTYNVDRVFDGTCSPTKVNSDLYDLLYKLWASFVNAKLFVINLLPRQHQVKNTIVTNINQLHLEKLCKAYGLVFINTEINVNHCFTHFNGIR